MLKIGVLISGSGTNLQAIIEAIEKEDIKAKIELVISNKKDAYGLVRAEKKEIDTLFLNHKDFDTIEKYNLKLIEELKNRDIGLVVLAGYLKVLTNDFIKAFKNKIINVHPSLLPSFCGVGCYGEKVHQQVIDYGCKYTGATVHFVDEGVDTGPIILQKIVEIDEDDTFISLQKKVLKIEHEILPMAVKLFCENRIVLDGRKTRILGEIK
ncbi:MAG: phosphoribosylglycinamide formyltransferase [Senegalia sp. (in: firmicutes)]|uniref:phosphoribosylglycinamide formyltransferase n=1 Tax=Senegalia sp. (in: firmicutes) TaxID=1924098 RepID=UPI003F987EA6